MTSPSITTTQLTKLKDRLDQHHPLPPQVVVNLREDLLLRWTFHSNAIEGNTLTLKETKVVLEGITIGGKTIQEHLEATNHRKAICFVESLVAKNQALSELQIRSIHQLILQDINSTHAGVYRSTNVVIAGAQYRPPDASHVSSLMHGFIANHAHTSASMHPVERAARAHADLVKIHPFIDGNGRTSRLIMNLELMKAGYPPSVITVDQQLAYYQTLDIAHTQQNYQPFLALIYQTIVRAFDPYWYALRLDIHT